MLKAYEKLSILFGLVHKIKLQHKNNLIITDGSIYIIVMNKFIYILFITQSIKYCSQGDTYKYTFII